MNTLVYDVAARRRLETLERIAARPSIRGLRRWWL